MSIENFVTLIYFNSIVLILSLVFIISPSCCSNHKHQPDNFMVLLMDGKSRMGSTPPSCHNRCNNCHPCMTVQAPTLPSHHRVDPSSFQEYSNYKPLGWKCRCGDIFYNP